VGKGKNMSYLFWIILPLAIWLMAWIVIDFMISENKGHLEDVINCKWGKDTK
tara:strand:+ start:3752 stop:3907 length:156 start_codon:yes stop_codon:yes gene_type:complete